MVHAAANQVSSREASQNLAAVGELQIDYRQVQRVAKRAGQELLDQRDADLGSYESLPLMQKLACPPGMKQPPQVVAISLDGGMLQIRQENPAEASEPSADAGVSGDSARLSNETTAPKTTPHAESPAAAVERSGANDLQDLEESEEGNGKSRHWREFKAGTLQVLESQEHTADPFPQVPATFLDRPHVARLAREIHNVAAPAGDKFRRVGPDEGPENEAADDASLDAFFDEVLQQASAQVASPSPEPASCSLAADDGNVPQNGPLPYRGPKILSRRVIATRKGAPQFARLVAFTAWMLGFAGAARKAFLGDGSAWLWKMQRRLFPRYTPILDFIHLLAYIYDAAHAGRDADSGWECYTQWVQLAWAGHVDELETALLSRLEELPAESDAFTHVKSTLTYVRNHREYMNYAEYRRLGLPITSSHVESTIKQLGRRVKGTEKFWGEEGAEGMLHLRSLYLSTDDPMKIWWTQREQQATGFRSYRRAA